MTVKRNCRFVPETRYGPGALSAGSHGNRCQSTLPYSQSRPISHKDRYRSGISGPAVRRGQESVVLFFVPADAAVTGALVVQFPPAAMLPPINVIVDGVMVVSSVALRICIVRHRQPSRQFVCKGHVRQGCSRVRIRDCKIQCDDIADQDCGHRERFGDAWRCHHCH